MAQITLDQKSFDDLLLRLENLETKVEELEKKEKSIEEEKKKLKEARLKERYKIYAKKQRKYVKEWLADDTDIKCNDGHVRAPRVLSYKEWLNS